MSSNGDCFVVLAPNCAGGTIIFGRNSMDASALAESQEVYYYDASNALEGKPDGGADVVTANGEIRRIILQKPRPGVWGGDYGANDHKLCIGVSWTAQDAAFDSGYICATDIVRLTLAVACNAADAVDRIGVLVTAHGAEDAKLNFVVCDPQDVWTVSCGGKLWAAQLFQEGHQRIVSNGLSVTTIIDKSSAGLADELKTLGLWDGEGVLNFAKCLNTQSDVAEWSGESPNGDGSYSLTDMFETLRSAADESNARSATVSVLVAKGISCHWFTATPNASESVFKPFVFAPNPKISPLTKVPPGGTLTLLHKLHGQRKPAAVDDLKALEAACVDEVNNYLAEHPTVNEELDELMKDCVEAEVKFYR